MLKWPEAQPGWKKWLGLSACVIALDQWTKIALVQYFEWHSPVIVLTDWFNLVLAYNRGAAFSLLAEGSELPRILFSALALIASGLLIAALRTQAQFTITSTALALILGGAIGNLIDRIRIGAVVDFIQWHWNDVYYWPAFNIADSAITVGAVLLVIVSLRTSGARE